MRAALVFALAVLARARARADVPPADQYSHANDLFGAAVALDGARLAIGAPGANVDGLDAGLVHIYELDGDRWELVARIGNPDPEPAHGDFARIVALAGDTLAVSARRPADDRGVVHVFERQRDEWRLRASLTDPDTDHDDFGRAFALAGDTLAVAASTRVRDRTALPPRALVYRHLDGEWREEAGLELPQSRFARSIALGDGTVLIEAESPALHAFRRDADRWLPDPTWTLDRPSIGAMALAGDTALVRDANALEVYRDRDRAWSLEARFDVTAEFPDAYGDMLALGRDLLAAGFSYTSPDLVSHDRVAVWRRAGDVWQHAGDIAITYDLPDGWPGSIGALAVDGRRIAVGAPYDGTPRYEQSGRVHLFADADGLPEVARFTPDDSLAGCGCRSDPGGAGLLGLLPLLLLARRGPSR